LVPERAAAIAVLPQPTAPLNKITLKQQFLRLRRSARHAHRKTRVPATTGLAAYAKPNGCTFTTPAASAEVAGAGQSRRMLPECQGRRNLHPFQGQCALISLRISKAKLPSDPEIDHRPTSHWQAVNELTHARACMIVTVMSARATTSVRQGRREEAGEGLSAGLRILWAPCGGVDWPGVSAVVHADQLAHAPAVLLQHLPPPAPSAPKVCQPHTSA
jgi:hypothetical protein